MAVPALAVKSRKSKGKATPFIAKANGAGAVAITGDFTGWSEEGIALARKADGDWETTLLLAPGEYEYRLRVDGEWRDDPQAQKRVSNPFGTENCVLTVV